MAKRRLGLIIVCAVALIGTPLAWFLNRRPNPVTFLDGKVPLKFYFPDELNREPLFDFNLPAIGRISYPRKRAILDSPFSSSDLPRGVGVAGYISLGERPGYQSSFLRIGNEMIFTSGVYVSEDPKARTSLERLLCVPYATDGRYRDVEIFFESNERRKIRLPVSREFGSSTRKSVKLPLGDVTLSLVPRTWKLTSAPVVFDVSVAGGENRIFLFQYDIAEGPDQALCSGLLMNGMLHNIQSLPAYPLRNLEGTLFELEPVPISIEIEAKGRSFEARVNGKLFQDVAGGQRQVETLGFKVLECNGRWTASNPINNRPHGGRFLPKRGGTVKSEKLGATGYRVKQRWPFSAELDIPDFHRRR